MNGEGAGVVRGKEDPQSAFADWLAHRSFPRESL